ncbi:hypothetical protein [Cryobacterium sp. PAMC25264]|uniref:hypothetical protein n=1 Tax=Cryobacterium sp. PAMC25264 TaxID=2861288 RepID=UPI001C62A790|nr:hypothetical protein [Cryobacterium sp. PAMC25264]QYF72693.1 hypothetical protein KY500_12885 [Cryobacterium sp. PAMC25264]
MTSDAPLNEILDLRIQISDGFHPVRLEEDIDSATWAREVVAEVTAQTGSLDHEDSMLGQLEELRIRLLAQLNPYLTAAVHIRPEEFMSLGLLLTFQVVEMEPEQGPDWYEQTARELAAETAADAFTLNFETWQGELPAGRFVGAHQVTEYFAAGDEIGWVEARTMFGVFPPNSTEMVQFTFTSADLATFGDMRAETQLIVGSLELDLGPTE